MIDWDGIERELQASSGWGGGPVPAACRAWRRSGRLAAWWAAAMFGLAEWRYRRTAAAARRWRWRAAYWDSRVYGVAPELARAMADREAKLRGEDDR